MAAVNTAAVAADPISVDVDIPLLTLGSPSIFLYPASFLNAALDRSNTRFRRLPYHRRGSWWTHMGLSDGGSGRQLQFALAAV